MASRRSSRKRSVGNGKLISALLIDSQLYYFELFFFFTSSNIGLFPFLMRVLFVCPPTIILTTGLMLMPGSCRPSMTRTRIWSTNNVSWINMEESLTPQQPSLRHRSSTENPYLNVLRLVRQSFGLTAGSSSPLPQPSMGIVGWW